MRYLVVILLLVTSPAHAILGALTCPDNSCPASVAEMIARRDQGGEEHCGATLIKADLMITAYHCLPESLKKTDAPCAGQISFFFPPNQALPSEVLECDHVHSYTNQPPSAEAHDQPDWAIIQLSNPSRRPPAVIRQLPLQNDETVYGYALNPNPFFGADELRRLSCSKVNMGYLFPLAGSGPTPLFSAADCQREIEAGNSGTGLFDAAGEMVGLVTAAVDTLAYNKQGLAKRGLLATKVTCIPSLFPTAAKECRLEATDEKLQTLATAIAVLEALPPATEPNDTVFGWAAPAPEIILARTKAFYPDLDWQAIEPILQNSKTFNKIFWREYTRAFPKIPSCVKPVPQDVSEWEDQLPYSPIAFGDPTLYPNTQDDLFLAVDGNLKLHPVTTTLSLNVHLEKISQNNQTAFSLTRTSLPAEVEAPNDEEAQAQVCRAEREAAETDCADVECAQNPRGHKIPSPKCQELYARRNWRRYVPPLNIVLPEC